MMPQLEVSALSVRYGAHLALSDATFSLDAGESAVILGANGAGKSSLLNGVAGLLRRGVTGRVTFEGADCAGLAAHDLPDRGIVIVPQGRGLFGGLSVRDNLELGRFPRRAAAMPSRLDEVIDYFPRLAERMAQQVNTMSGGEQQMVAIGRALMSHPRLLMLDEPSLGLSPIMTSEMFRSLARVIATGVTLLMVEQNARRSLGLVTRGLLVSNGSIVRVDRSDALLADRGILDAYLGGAAA
jgi:ABC-type branched-subunit amino acid transport system ATPase component